MTLCLTHTSPEGRFDCIIEDDDRVCYAYLIESDRIVADVWLYNSTPAGEQPEWSQPDAKEQMPFRNPSEFGDQEVRRISEQSSIQVEWSGSAEDRCATIRVDGEIWAVLNNGVRPGCCRHARKAGPLAVPFVLEDDS